MGLGTDQFVSGSAVSKELLCPLCFEVFEEPVSCAGKPCDCIFCRRCILTALRHKPRCPMDRKAMTPRGLAPHRFAKSLTNELQVFCRQRHRGCFWTGRLDSRPAHQEVCLAARVASLEAALADRDYSIQDLESHLAGRQRLEAVLADRDDAVQDLEAQLAGRDDTIQGLQAALALESATASEWKSTASAHGTEVAALTAAVEEGNAAIRALKSAAAVQSSEIAVLTAAVAELRAAAARREAHVRDLERALAARGGEVRELTADTAAGRKSGACGSARADTKQTRRLQAGASASSSSHAEKYEDAFAAVPVQVAGSHPAACLDLRDVKRLREKADEGSAWAELQAVAPGLEQEWRALARLLEARAHFHPKFWPVSLYTSMGTSGSNGPVCDSTLSRDINRQLRILKYGSLENFLVLLRGVLANDPIACRLPSRELWRGMDIPNPTVEVLSQYFPLGCQVAFPGLTSTSVKRDAAESYSWYLQRVLVRISVPDEHASDVFAVGHLSTWPWECEVLIMPLVPMRVDGLKSLGHGVQLDLTVIGRSPLF